MQIGPGEQYYDFNEAGITTAVGCASFGVFVLFRDSQCIFVKKSDHVENALLTLLKSANHPTTRHRPNRFQYQSYPASQLEKWEKYWADYFHPLVLPST